MEKRVKKCNFSLCGSLLFYKEKLIQFPTLSLFYDDATISRVHLLFLCTAVMTTQKLTFVLPHWSCQSFHGGFHKILHLLMDSITCIFGKKNRSWPYLVGQHNLGTTFVGMEKG